MPSKQPSFALTAAANRVLIPLLESRGGRGLGRRLSVVEYLGRRSGRHHRLVTEYAIVGRTVRIPVGRSESKRWWRNFMSPHPMHLRIAGQDHVATAHVERDDGTVTVVAELVPRAGSRSA
jgi:hypothetical protein